MSTENEQQTGSGLPQLYSPTSLTRPGEPRLPWDRGPEESGRLNLARLLDVLMRRKALLLAVLVTVVALAAVELYTTTPLFQAAARVQIDPEETNILPYQDIASTGQIYNSFQYQMTQLEKLRSRELARRVVERLDLKNTSEFYTDVKPGALTRLRAWLRSVPPAIVALVSGAPAVERPKSSAPDEVLDPADPAVARLRGGIGAQIVGDTRLIEVTYISPVADFAARVANAVAEEFVRMHLESRYLSTARASEFLQVELDEMKSTVESLEEQLLDYAREKNILALSERETLHRKRLSDLTEELTGVESELMASAALVRTLESAGGGEFPEIAKDAAVENLQAELASLEAQLAALSTRYGPEWPAVKELRRKITESRNQLALSRQRAIASARRSYQLLRDRREQLAATTAEQRLLVDQLDNDSIQYNILKREVETSQELYDGLLQRLKEARVAASLESSNILVAETAVVPSFHTFPLRQKVLTRALIIGLMLGVGAVFLAEFLDNTIKGPDDLQQITRLPSLGVVPSLDITAGRDRRQVLRQRRKSAARPVLASSGLEFLRGREWEAYRSLRTSLMLSHSGKPPQVILVTSPGPGEGKTTTAANLAVALAQTGEHTVMIDLDLRKPVMADSFDLSDERGMSTYLSGNSDLASQIQQTAFTNLFLVPAGPIPPNPPELIGSERMDRGLQLLREYFTYVIVDSPPALGISDSFVTAPLTDGALLVVRAGKTPKVALRKTVEQFDRIGTNLFGVVVNDADAVGGQYGHYGYSYGYSYSAYDGYHPEPAESGSKKSAAKRSA